ncbi:MAG: MarR family transcriptional regulator [Proteobacteria bacterium]|nr:MarR family transcriptional regulator [Pseudomonadota bacterium]
MSDTEDAKMKSNATSGSGSVDQDEITLYEEYEFFILMTQVMEGMKKARERELKPVGISMIQSAVLYVLDEANHPLAPIQIARQLLRDPGSIHQLLDRMEDSGLVKRIRSAKEKRVVHVKITKKGEELRRIQKNEVLAKILGKLSKLERKQLWSILKNLREATYIELSPPPLFP